MAAEVEPTPSVDRTQLNDELTALLSHYGWSADTDDDDLDLNDLTHVLADWIEARVR